MHSDILILGGGIVGLAIALELRLRGATVHVLNRSDREAATQAAAGMLAPQAEGILDPNLLQLCQRSRSLYGLWTEKIEQLSGLPTGYWPCGILAPVYDGAAPGTSEGTPVSCDGLPPLRRTSVYLDRAAIHQHQPGLSPAVVGGWWFPEDGQVDNRCLGQALHQAAQAAGVVIHSGVTVTDLVSSGNQIQSVHTSAGLWQANHYILTAGSWSQQLLPIPVRPVKGQMLSVRVPQGCSGAPPAGTSGRDELKPLDCVSRDSKRYDCGQSPLPLQQVLFGSEIYIVPRQDGQILIGATVETVGFQPHNTPQGIQQLLAAAIRLYPPLQDFPIQEFWWGFRPGTPDENPILGASPYANLTLATGHYRNGILLAPITAMLIADWVWQQVADPFLHWFRWDRFASADRSANAVSQEGRMEARSLGGMSP